jgi:hypothetical protein
MIITSIPIVLLTYLNLNISLTQNLPCVIIISVKIEKTYPSVKTEQIHKG